MVFRRCECWSYGTLAQQVQSQMELKPRELLLQARLARVDFRYGLRLESLYLTSLFERVSGDIVIGMYLDLT